MTSLLPGVEAVVVADHAPGNLRVAGALFGWEPTGRFTDDLDGSDQSKLEHQVRVQIGPCLAGHESGRGPRRVEPMP